MKNFKDTGDSDCIKPPTSKESIAEWVKWLEDNPIPPDERASAAEIDAQIEEIRNSWDDEIT